MLNRKMNEKIQTILIMYEFPSKKYGDRIKNFEE